MVDPFLTPAEALRLLHRKDRHTLDRLVRRGVLERVNISGGSRQARWLYRLKNVETEAPEPSPLDLKLAELLRVAGL